MLKLENVSKRFADRLLFDNISLAVNHGDRIGLVGANGTGKSTLIGIMAGTVQPDQGQVRLGSGSRVGYLPQGLFDLESGRLRDALDSPTGGFFHALAQLDIATLALAGSGGGEEAAIHAWELAQAAFDAAGGYLALDRMETLLAQFSVPRASIDTPLAEMSGGERTRAGLAAILAMQPDILLLDEPTNHLDTSGQQWLGDFLRAYDGAVVMVSHDRAFLDDTTNRIAALGMDDSGLALHTGNYSAFVEAQETRRQAEFETYKRQQERIAGLQSSIDQNERSARKIESETINFHYRKRAQKIARSATVRRNRLERMLESEDLVEKPGQAWGLALDFPEPIHQARDVVTLDHVTVVRDQGPVLNAVGLTVHYGERIALIGDNGAGKTTLVRVISGELVPDSGYRRLGPGLQLGLLAQDQDTLDPDQTVLESVQEIKPGAESEHRTELHRYLFGGDSVHRQIRDLSWGERTRLMFAHIAIPGADLLLLDEPLNHLDIEAREAFEQALAAFPGAVIFVAHDRYAVKRLATRVIRVADGNLHDVDIDADPAFAMIEA